MARIEIPIDASGVPQNERGKQRVRVALKYGDTIQSEVVPVDSGKADVSLNVEARGPLTIAVGPENISAAELFRRDTPTVAVKPRTVKGELVYEIQPIVVGPNIWRRWLYWCTQYTISGYVHGSDGNPVPSAQVSAFNIERFFWWSSTQQVGSTVTTDPTGHFTITFERCCGWLPWYWWELQEWRLDPILHEQIQRVLQLVPDLHVGKPSPALELSFA
ncbi:MAG: carboxypeptidase regulatory-like domain-containing protein, partial [Mycobacteriaceae bacterium]|nr:carboxypeptidase regulatory-like domain-containing protein [Mycobacteriaceae bacterium]